MKKVYRLFAARVSEENVAQAAVERFHRVTPGYILLYTEKESPGQAWAEVDGEDLKRLTKQDEAWLFDCAGTLYLEVLQRRKKETKRSFAELIDELENALKAEREMAERGA